MNRYILIIVVLAAAVGYGYIQDHPEVLNAAGAGGISTAQVPESIEDGRDDIITTESGDPEIEAAYAQTQQYLEQFITEFRNSGTNSEDYTVKVAFPIVDNSVEADEIIWTSGLEDLGEGKFAAILANDPEWMEGYKFGDRVEFTYDMIRDWALRADDKFYGHFTTRALMQHMSPVDKAMISGILMEDAVPPSFND